jgi:spermidine/putrescine transport system substrate-binding protein
MKSNYINNKLKPVFSAFVVVFSLFYVLCFSGCQRTEERINANKQEKEKAEIVRVFTWGEYFDEETFVKFEEKTGIKVEYVTFGGTDEMEARLKSEPGNFDVIIADDSVLDQMEELMLIGELDHSKLPNLKNIDTEFLNIPFDPGNRISAPYMWGTTLIAYRADKISDPQKSWNLLWNPELKGKVMMLGERFEVLSTPLFLLGYDLNSKDLTHLEEAAALLHKQLNQVDARYGNDENVRNSLKDGSVWAAMCYSGDAALVAEENENISYFIPREGAPLWIDSFAIVRDSKVPEAAHQFINFMLEPDIAAANSNFTWYASPNAKATPLLNEELVGDTAIYPPSEVMERCEFFTKLNNAREQKMNDLWFKLHSELRKRNLLVEKESNKESDEIVLSEEELKGE